MIRTGVGRVKINKTLRIPVREVAKLAGRLAAERIRARTKRGADMHGSRFLPKRKKKGRSQKPMKKSGFTLASIQVLRVVWEGKGLASAYVGVAGAHARKAKWFHYGTRRQAARNFLGLTKTDANAIRREIYRTPGLIRETRKKG